MQIYKPQKNCAANKALSLGLPKLDCSPCMPGMPVVQSPCMTHTHAQIVSGLAGGTSVSGASRHHHLTTYLA